MSESGRNIVVEDEETGEQIVYFVNRETGERQPRHMVMQARQTRRPYEHHATLQTLSTQNVAPPTNRTPVQIYDGTSPRLLLMLTSCIFPSVVTVLLILFEVYLHVYCHVKNRALKDESFYYRSPFHALTSRFCGACRESQSAMRVGLMQDQRRNRYHYLQGIVS